MYPVKGMDWSVETEIPKSILDMSIDEYIVSIGGHSIQSWEDSEYNFDEEYLEYKRKATMESLDDDLEEYFAGYQSTFDGLDNPFLDLSLAEIQKTYQVPELDESEEEYPFDQSWLNKKKNLTHSKLDLELDLYRHRFKAAGCIFYSFEGNKILLLLQERDGAKYLEDFGGKRSEGELFHECAAREVFEESNGLLNLSGANFKGIHSDYAFYMKGMKKLSPALFGKKNNDGNRRVGWYDYQKVRHRLNPRIPKLFLDELLIRK